MISFKFGKRKTAAQTNTALDVPADTHTAQLPAPLASPQGVPSADTPAAPSIPLLPAPADHPNALAAMLVEREREFERLTNYWKATEEGHGKVVLLSGEAGHGKSTLADAFLKYVQTDPNPHRVARAACSAQSGHDEPFWPFADVIGQLAHAPNSKKMAEDILDAVLDLAPSWASVIPVAGGVVGASIKTAQVVRTRTRTSDVPNPDKLLRDYVGALKKVADKQPVLIFIDDLHWSDPGSVKLLSHLARNISSLRVLVIVAYRPSDIAVEGHPLHDLINELLRYDTDIEIAIPPLSAHGATALVNKLYPANKFPETLAGALFTNTGGSPFFIVESLRLMQSREQIVRDPKDGKWMLVRDLNDEDLPRSVEAVIRKRMERMPAALQETLALAAVQGPVFESAVLANVMGVDELTVMKMIEPAEKTHDVIEYVGDVELEQDITSRYHFSSSLIQKELLQTLRGKQLMIAHRKTAEGLEKLWDENSADLAPKLAIHYEKGKVWDKAVYYTTLAGKQARAAGAIPQAIALFENAERLLGKMATPSLDQQFEVDDNLSYLYELDSSYDKAEARTRNALTAGFDKLGWRKYANLQMRLAKLADNAGHFTESLEILQHVQDMMTNTSTTDATSPEAFQLRAEISQALTRVSRADEGAKLAEDGLAALTELPSSEETQRLRIHMLGSLAEAHEAQGNYRQVSNLLDEICAQARQLRALDTLSEALVNLAEVNLMLGQYERVKDFVRDIITTAQQISSESLMGSAYLVAGRMLIYQAKPFAALRQLEEADRLVTQVRLFAARPQLLVFRAVALILLGRGDEAQPLLDQARGLAQSSGSREAVALVDMFMAVLMLSRHDGLKALPLAQSAAQVFTEEQARFEQAWALRVVGGAYRELGQLKQSRKAYDEAKAIFQAIGNQHQVGVTTEEAER